VCDIDFYIALSINFKTLKMIAGFKIGGTDMDTVQILPQKQDVGRQILYLHLHIEGKHVFNHILTLFYLKE